MSARYGGMKVHKDNKLAARVNFSASLGTRLVTFVQAGSSYKTKKDQEKGNVV